MEVINMINNKVNIDNMADEILARIKETSYENFGQFEQTPHSHSPASKRSVGGGLEWGIFYIKKIKTK